MPKESWLSTEAGQKKMGQIHAENKAVRLYLDGLAEKKRTMRKGPKRTPTAVAKQLEKVDARLNVDDLSEIPAIQRIKLVQTRKNLEAELKAFTELPDLEASFSKHVLSFSERNGIDYSSWRELGVPPAVLDAAGIPDAWEETE